MKVSPAVAAPAARAARADQAHSDLKAALPARADPAGQEDRVVRAVPVDEAAGVVVVAAATEVLSMRVP